MIAEVVGALLVLAYGCLMLWSVYEMWTMPPDDERWELYADAMDHERRDDWP